jgi:hypothetical protein
MGDDELAQLRWVLKLADQAPDDFANFEALDQKGLTAYRHQIAFARIRRRIPTGYGDGPNFLSCRSRVRS